MAGLSCREEKHKSNSHMRRLSKSPPLSVSRPLAARWRPLASVCKGEQSSFSCLPRTESASARAYITEMKRKEPSVVTAKTEVEVWETRHQDGALICLNSLCHPQQQCEGVWQTPILSCCLKSLLCQTMSTDYTELR